MNKQNEQFDHAIEALRGISVPSGPSDELIRQTLNRMEQAQSQTLPPAEGKRRFLMNSLKKLSIAAVLVIGVSAFLLFNRTTGSIALADVYSKVQQARTFMYAMSMTMSGMGELTGQPIDGAMTSEGTIIISTEFGMKMENHMQVQLPDGTTQNITQLAYMLPNDKIIVSVMPEQKIYQKIELTDQLLEETKKQNNDPREMIRQMMNCNYTSLGQSEINGIKVQGFETTDPAYSAGVGGDIRAVLWVDARTWLPIQSEVSMSMGEKMKIDIVISDFQWDFPVEADAFTFVIPDDYKEFGSMKMPEMNEEAAVKGFRVYIDVFGMYPEKLDLVDLTSSMTRKLRDSEVSESFGEKMKAARAAGQDGMETFSQELMSPILSLGMFYANLSQNKYEPAYYGAQLTPQDTDAVLLRWKTDSGKYKVIFGDLSVAEMDYEELVKIEPEVKPENKPKSESTIGIDDPAAQAVHSGAQLTRFGQSAMNIKRMLIACFMYGQKNDQWPESLEALLGQGIEPELLVNPARPDVPNGYVYIKPVKPEHHQNSPQTVIVIYEAYETWENGIYVGFLDGHVEFVKDEAAFLKLLSQ
jgi:hypothetical protein